jgi:hypothetical protein
VFDLAPVEVPADGALVPADPTLARRYAEPEKAAGTGYGYPRLDRRQGPRAPDSRLCRSFSPQRARGAGGRGSERVPGRAARHHSPLEDRPRGRRADHRHPARGTICPVEAVQTWVARAEISTGFVFPSVLTGGRLGKPLPAQSVAHVVKQSPELAGLDPRSFSGHGLRAGFCTSAAAHGASVWKMMDVSRPKSVDTLRGYVRNAAPR